MKIILILLFLLFVEYYASSALKNASSQLNPVFFWILISLYYCSIILELLGFYFLFKEGSTAVSSGWTKYLITIIFAFLIGKLIIALIMLIGDIGLVIHKGIQSLRSSLVLKTENRLPQNSYRITRSTFISTLAVLTGGILAGGLIYGISNRYNYKVRRIRLKFKNLPSAFKGLKIIQLSDIHSGSLANSEAVQKGIDLIKKEEPDLILFTGDLVNNRANEIIPWKSVLGQLQATLGVYATLGNHDYGDYVEWPSKESKIKNLEQLKQYEAEMGWKMLNNEHVILSKGNDKIALIGVENWGAKGHFSQYGDLKKATNGLENQACPFKILMSHDPSHWDAKVRKNYPDIDLTLSGHTHGMQFGIDIPGLKWSPIQYMYKEWAGLYRKNKQYLYVNRGFGFIGYQGRLGILPEITVFELG